MSTKSSVWDKILKVIIAVASALIGALSAHAMTVERIFRLRYIF